MDKYIFRRELLQIAKDYEPALLDLESFFSWPRFRQRALAKDEIAAELRGLASAGYLVDKRPGREPLYALTDAGRQQIGMECDLAEYVWGEQASKFQG